MATRSAQSSRPSADSTAAVDAFMQALDHPHKDAIEALRRVLLGLDPAVAEGIKWNAPSFRTSGYFATTHLRAKTGIGVILHLGAKARELPDGLRIDDPAGLLTWLGTDRAMVAFADADDLHGKREAFERVLRQWLQYV
ncbi:MAG: DUF1801 domain-containing protein [Rhodanobacteraceae bacterium]|jgi:hypothetical protein|nr:DUF1801 domain-containing protein [Rhodanobacteraceae bacterium]